MYINKTEHAISKTFEAMPAIERAAKIAEMETALRMESNPQTILLISQSLNAAKRVHSDLLAVEREAIASVARVSWTQNEPYAAPGSSSVDSSMRVAITPRMAMRLAALSGAVLVALGIAEFLRYLYASGLMVWIGGAAVGVLLLMLLLSSISDARKEEAESIAESTPSPRIVVTQTQTTEIF